MISIHTLDALPTASDFTPLTEHQAQTPSSFFGAPPVLHYTLGECDLLVSRVDLRRHAFLGGFDGTASGVNGDSVGDGIGEEDGEGWTGGSGGGVESLEVAEGVRGFVTSG